MSSFQKECALRKTLQSAAAAHAPSRTARFRARARRPRARRPHGVMIYSCHNILGYYIVYYSRL